MEYHERLTWQGVVPLIKLLVGFSKQSLLWLQSNTLLEYIEYYWLLITDIVLASQNKAYCDRRQALPKDNQLWAIHCKQEWFFTSYYLQVLWTCRIQSQSALLCVNWLKLPHISYRMTTAHSMTLYILRKIHKSITMISWKLQSSVKAMNNGKILDTAHIEKNCHLIRQ